LVKDLQLLYKDVTLDDNVLYGNNDCSKYDFKHFTIQIDGSYYKVPTTFLAKRY